MADAIHILSLVSYKFLPPDMGGQKGIAFFNRYLSRQAKLMCVTTKDNTQVAEAGYPIKNILSSSKTRYINLFYFFTLRKIIRQQSITHLIIEHPYYGWLGILLKWFCHVKLIVHSHNIESLRFKSMATWWWGILWHYEKCTHRHADHNFFIQDNDRNYAIEKFKLQPSACTTVTYGFELMQTPAAGERAMAKQTICKIHGIPEKDSILLFNGTLGYKPNLDALQTILEKINPRLLAVEGFKYRIIICGSKLPANFNDLVEYKEKNIIYAGFVHDINLYFKGADIFINPVLEGGGIKTKVVEALGYNLSVVSTRSGAIGIPPEITGKKLFIADDGNWENFTQNILSVNTSEGIPPEFFQHFYWGFITTRALNAII